MLAADIEAYLTTEVDRTVDGVVYLSPVQVPLITHSQRLYYDSTEDIIDTGNVHYNGASGDDKIHGVKFNELKYALKLSVIIKAIEEKYGLNFSSDFFKGGDNSFDNLYMWLHRKKGNVENLSGLNEGQIEGFTNGNSATTASVMSNNSLSLYSYTPPTSVLQYTQINLKSTTSSTSPYRISIRKNGIEVINSGSITTGAEFTTSVPASQIEQDAQYTVYIESDFNITFSNITFQVYKYDNTNIPAPPIIYSKGYAITNFVYTSSFEFDITQQIPDIKIIDFLSGLFKMFNLTAFVEINETEITVKTLDSFYSLGGSYDITKYVDVSKSQVNIALPYRKINFRHEDTKTLLAAKHTQLFGETWGEAGYDSGQKLDGSIYNVKTPFAQLKYERLIDENPSGVGTTNVQWGWFVDDNQESYIGKPLLFYPIRITSGNEIAFLNSPTDQDPITTYNIPSNSVALSSATSSYNMNFNQEQNEWGSLDGDTGFTNSLFEAYYKNYITSVFNESNRITKVTAYLPLRILRNYTLADRFVINGKSYKINSIKTNLKNGKSDLELLNDL